MHQLLYNQVFSRSLTLNPEQKHSRYHSPEIQDLHAQLLRVQETLDSQCAKAWQVLPLLPSATRKPKP